MPASITTRGKLGKVANDDRADWREAWALFPGSVAYVWHAGRHASAVQDSLEASGFEVRAADHLGQGPLCVEPRATITGSTNRAGMRSAERPARTGGDRKQSTLWPIPAREDDGHGHGTQKPVECMKRPIENNSSPGQAIYEPFCGSGTTIIAAEMTGRSCHAIEIDPAYVDVAIAALAGLHGRERPSWKALAILRGNGSRTARAQTDGPARPSSPIPRSAARLKPWRPTASPRPTSPGGRHRSEDAAQALP